jgi:hypothetical protein
MCQAASRSDRVKVLFEIAGIVGLAILLPPFAVPVVTAFVRAANLSCRNAGKAQKYAHFGDIWGIPVKLSHR